VHSRRHVVTGEVTLACNCKFLLSPGETIARVPHVTEADCGSAARRLPGSLPCHGVPRLLRSAELRPHIPITKKLSIKLQLKVILRRSQDLTSDKDEPQPPRVSCSSARCPTNAACRDPNPAPECPRWQHPRRYRRCWRWRAPRRLLRCRGRGGGSSVGGGGALAGCWSGAPSWPSSSS
jgi:hypothetical protein